MPGRRNWPGCEIQEQSFFAMTMRMWSSGTLKEGTKPKDRTTTLVFRFFHVQVSAWKNPMVYSPRDWRFQKNWLIFEDLLLQVKKIISF